MEITYSKHIPNDEYFVINKINSVYSLDENVVSSNLYDIKKLEYKNKTLVYILYTYM